MIKIISKDNIELFDNSVIEMKTSNGLADSNNIYIVSTSLLTSFEASFDNNEYFKLFNVQNGKVVDVETLTMQNIDKFEQNNYHIYRLNVTFEPHDSNTSSTLRIRANNMSFNVVFNGYVSTLDERLVVVLQNLKKSINDDYMTAFMESKVNNSSFDYELYNRKIREYLINIFDISTIQGSYKNLFSVIDYFGYGGLLKLKEYWISDDKYKSTDISNQVLNYIDKSLVGFKKTNMLSLNYKINDFDGYDEDGLPIYKNVLDDTDNILIKLRSLKLILEKEFLALDTHIVDIVGELDIAIGHELNIHLNNFKNVELNITDNLNKKFKFEYVTDNIEILKQKVIVKPWVFNKDGDSLITINNESSVHVGDYFLIESIVDDTFNDFDMMTKYLVDDFGLLEIHADIDKNRYQLIQFTIFNETNEIVFESDLTEIDNVVNNGKILLGIRKEDKYRISFSLIDYYGCRTFFGVPKLIHVHYKEMRIKLGNYMNVGEYSPSIAWTTFKTINDYGSYVPSAINTNLDINTWNSENNIPEMIISRMYENDYDMLSIQSSLNNLNSVSINSLSNSPIYTWSTNYFISIIDVIRGDGSCGFMIKTNINDDFVEFFSPNMGDETSTISNLINILNTSSLADEFTFDINYYSDNPNALITETRPMLRLKSKEIGYENKYISIITTNEKYDDFYKHYTNNIVNAYSNVDAKLEFSVFAQTTDDLIVKCGDETIIIEDVEIQSNLDLKDIFDGLKLNGVYTFTNNNNTSIIIFSENDIEISHSSFGLQKDISRAKHLKYIKVFQSGSDVKIGTPLFACIDNGRKSEMSDIIWTLINPLTGEEISKQKAYAFRYVINRSGVYSIKCEFIFNNKNYNFNIDGFVIVIE